MGSYGVIIFRPQFGGGLKACTDLNALNRSDTHQRFCQICIELVEHRFSKTLGNPSGHNFDYSANGITLLSNASNTFFHLFHSIHIRTTKYIFSDHIQIAFDCLDTAKFYRVCQDFNLFGFKQGLGDSSGSHPCHGFPRGSPPAPAPITYAVLGHIGYVAVTGPKQICIRRIRIRVGVFVFNHNHDGRSGRHIFKNTRHDDRPIRFPSAGTCRRPSRPPAVQHGLDNLFIQWYFRGTAVNDDAHAFSV